MHEYITRMHNIERKREHSSMFGRLALLTDDSCTYNLSQCNHNKIQEYAHLIVQFHRQNMLSE